jgi:hypothetical protein
MNTINFAALKSLQKLGWVIRFRAEFLALPEPVKQRYPWVTNEVESLLGSIEIAQRTDEKLWLLASENFLNQREDAFAWNEWELQSLAAAEGNLKWTAEIRQFWDGHMPIGLSVTDGYAYFAVRPDGSVVYGREPEYEDVEVFAASFSEFLDQIRTTCI